MQPVSLSCLEAGAVLWVFLHVAGDLVPAGSNQAPKVEARYPSIIVRNLIVAEYHPRSG